MQNALENGVSACNLFLGAFQYFVVGECSEALDTCIDYGMEAQVNALEVLASLGKHLDAALRKRPVQARDDILALGAVGDFLWAEARGHAREARGCSQGLITRGEQRSQFVTIGRVRLRAWGQLEASPGEVPARA